MQPGQQQKPNPLRVEAFECTSEWVQRLQQEERLWLSPGRQVRGLCLHEGLQLFGKVHEHRSCREQCIVDAPSCFLAVVIHSKTEGPDKPPPFTIAAAALSLVGTGISSLVAETPTSLGLLAMMSFTMADNALSKAFGSSLDIEHRY